MEYTKTPNGDSNRISLEEARALESQTAACNIQIVDPDKVNTLPTDKQVNARVTALTVESERTHREEKPGDSLTAVEAARIGDKPEVVVKDGKKVGEEPKQPNTMENGNDR